MIYIFLLIFLLQSSTAMKLPPPILVLGGFGSSRLVLQKQMIWPPPIHTYLFQYNQWKRHVITNPNITTLELGNPDSFNLPFIFFRRRYFCEIFKRHPNQIHPIPYDFRRIDDPHYLRGFYHTLQRYIESFQKPVVIVCHSTGGLVFHWFLHTQSAHWKQRHIDCIVNVNVPFGGLILPLHYCYQRSILNVFLGIDILQNLGAMIMNLPNPAVISPILLRAGGEPIQKYYDFLGLQTMETRYNQNRGLISQLGESTGVKTHIVYSGGMIDTPVALETVGLTEWGKYNPSLKIVYGLGDGVVPLSSLLIPPKKWKHQEKVKYHSIHNYGHTDILKSTELKDILEKILTGMI
jgi:hypothetical protein